MSVTGAIIAGVGAASSIGSAAIGAHAAGHAADTQANAANNAAQLEKQAADQSLAFQKEQWNTQQKNFAPWLSAGKGALTNLQYLLGIPQAPQSTSALQSPGSFQYGGGTVIPPDGSMRGNTYQGGARMAFDGMEPYNGPGMAGAQDRATTMTAAPQGGTVTPGADPQLNTSLGNFGQLLQPWTEQFQAPTNITEQNDPGYQARLKLGTDAIQKSAAARGGVLGGGTAKDLNSYAQDYASNEYGNVYARDWNAYSSRYNNFQNNNTNLFNRLGALSGMGQQTASQLGMMGQNAANNVSNTLLTSAGQIGQQGNNAEAARASGYIGSANAINGGLNGVNSALQNFLLLQQLGGGGGAASGGGFGQIGVTG